MAGIREEIKRYFNEGDALAKLILINLGVYLLYILLRILGTLTQTGAHLFFIEWIALPSDLGKLATRPWTLVTYMFTHQDFFHILFNVLYLYFSGTLFIQYLGGRKLLSTYILGGLIGGALYVIAYNVFPFFSEAVAGSNNRGASAGVMAILVAIATYAPNFRVRLFFVLEVKLWVVAIFAVLLDLVYLPDSNAGGHIAHLGGALFGYVSIRQLKNGSDITEGFSRFMDNMVNFFKPRPKIRKVYTSTTTRNDYKYNQRKAHTQERIDEILDKINRSGYDSLSKEERDFLFKVGKD